MADNNKKTIYIIIAVAAAVLAIPVAIILLGALGGIFYMSGSH